MDNSMKYMVMLTALVFAQMFFLCSESHCLDFIEEKSIKVDGVITALAEGENGNIFFGNSEGSIAKIEGADDLTGRKLKLKWLNVSKDEPIVGLHALSSGALIVVTHSKLFAITPGYKSVDLLMSVSDNQVAYRVNQNVVAWIDPGKREFQEKHIYTNYINISDGVRRYSQLLEVPEEYTEQAKGRKHFDRFSGTEGAVFFNMLAPSHMDLGNTIFLPMHSVKGHEFIKLIPHGSLDTTFSFDQPPPHSVWINYSKPQVAIAILISRTGMLKNWNMNL